MKKQPEISFVMEHPKTHHKIVANIGSSYEIMSSTLLGCAFLVPWFKKDYKHSFWLSLPTGCIVLLVMVYIAQFASQVLDINHLTVNTLTTQAMLSQALPYFAIGLVILVIGTIQAGYYYFKYNSIYLEDKFINGYKIVAYNPADLPIIKEEMATNYPYYYKEMMNGVNKFDEMLKQYKQNLLEA